jgi:hypothetical protein
MISKNHGVLPTDTTANVLEDSLLESFAYIALSLLVLVRTSLGYALGGIPLLTDEAALRLGAGRADRRIFRVRRRAFAVAGALHCWSTPLGSEPCCQ